MANDQELQDALREIALIAARHQFVMKARHIAGVNNRVPDWLSRWYDCQARRQFRHFARDSSLKHRRIGTSLLQYEHEW